MKKLLVFALLSLCWSIEAQNVETRTVGDYDKVMISGWFDVELVEGKEGKIKIQARPSVLKHIESEVINGKLKIEWTKRSNINPFYSFSSVKITIPVEEIEGVALGGSGSITSKMPLKADSFSTSLAGSGKIDLEVHTKKLKSVVSGSGKTILQGKSENYEAEVAGSGDIKAYELEADFVAATISGSADINVKVNEGIRARISGSGDVNYLGSPDKIDSKVSGSGSVSKKK
ncbi:MAG: head GIN domain-containing protein [Flavobacteriaceae bacterium]